MRRHLAPVALALAFREIVDRQLPRCDTAAEHQSAVAIISGDEIAIAQLNAESGECLMPHSADMEMSFALPIQALLAKITVPALQHERQKPQFLFLGQFSHTMRREMNTWAAHLASGKHRTRQFVSMPKNK